VNAVLDAALIPVAAISATYAVATAWIAHAEEHHWHLHHPRHKRIARHEGRGSDA